MSRNKTKSQTPAPNTAKPETSQKEQAPAKPKDTPAPIRGFHKANLSTESRRPTVTFYEGNRKQDVIAAQTAGHGLRFAAGQTKQDAIQELRKTSVIDVGCPVHVKFEQDRQGYICVVVTANDGRLWSASSKSAKEHTVVNALKEVVATIRKETAQKG